MSTSVTGKTSGSRYNGPIVFPPERPDGAPIDPYPSVHQARLAHHTKCRGVGFSATFDEASVPARGNAACLTALRDCISRRYRAGYPSRIHGARQAGKFVVDGIPRDEPAGDAKSLLVNDQGFGEE